MTIQLQQLAPNTYGLGNTYTPPANLVNAVNSINQLTSIANQLTPNVALTYQSDFSKATSAIAQVAGTAAAVAQVVPGVGQAVGIVLGAVAGVAAVLSKIFLNSKAKQYAAERAQYETAIQQILADNLVIDQQYNQLKNAIDQFKAELAGYGISGLGLCLINCNKKKEKARLDNTKEAFNELTAIQKKKLQLVTDLYTEYNQILQNLLDVRSSSNRNTYLLVGLGLLLGVTGFVYATRK